MSKFACSRCGNCCKDTLCQSGEYLFGLYLEPEEIQKFPKEVVFPLFGRGQKQEVTAYQLGINRCPNYEEAQGLGRCRIHADRPIVCQAFPVMSPFKVAGSCPVVKKSKDGVDMDSLTLELSAHRKKVELMMSRPENEWVWPLNRKEWILLEKRA